eukprot:3395714-Amphidinium_carterae.1
MEDTMQQLIAEVQRLVTEQQAQSNTIATLQRELQDARARPPTGNGRMDPLKLGKPPTFTGTEA